MTMITSLRAAGPQVVAAGRAEWIKLRSLRFTRFAVLASILLMILFSMALSASIAASAANGYDITASAASIAASATTVGQLPLLMITITVITTEYGSQAIRLTLRGTPLRGQLLLAKTAVTAVVAFVTGVLLAAAGMITATAILGGTNTATAGEVVRSALGIGGYLALVGILMVGVGAITRSTIVSILVALLLLLAVPVLTQVSAADWLQTVRTYLPSTAGAIMMSPDGGDYGAGVAVAILAVWAALAQLGGYVLLWLRDA
ncbi:ABC transporter permease [Microlunatus speluncae]|uniref:ABC transporter permease n=1 Tax=Microlunatus speluncae TaxID=2594267 RepID=UPI0012665A84|nr:ABC transporter permease [Microlunatus speluncae]